MTLDMHPKEWRRIAKLLLLWLALPEDKAEHLIDVLPQSEQDKFDAFLLTLKTPQKALKELETHVKHGDVDFVDTLISKLPRIELERLVKAGLKRGKLIDNLSKMDVEELRDLVCLCSFPKNLLAFLVFIDGLDPERQGFLLS